MCTAYIVEAPHTAGARRGGALRNWHPADRGAAVLNALMTRSGIDRRMKCRGHAIALFETIELILSKVSMPTRHRGRQPCSRCLSADHSFHRQAFAA